MLKFEWFVEDSIDSDIFKKLTQQRIGMTCHRNDSTGPMNIRVVADRIEDFYPVDSRQDKVGEEEVGRNFIFDPCFAVTSEMYVVIAEELESGIDSVPDRFFIIDHKDSCFRLFGQLTTTVM